MCQPASQPCMRGMLTSSGIAPGAPHCSLLTSLPVVVLEKKCLMAILAEPGPHHRSAWAPVFWNVPSEPVVQICCPTALQQRRCQPPGGAITSWQPAAALTSRDEVRYDHSGSQMILTQVGKLEDHSRFVVSTHIHNSLPFLSPISKLATIEAEPRSRYEVFRTRWLTIPPPALEDDGQCLS